MTDGPLISLITINLNNLKGLQDTMASVFAQSSDNFEFIIIDGGSEDGSREFIEKYKEKIDVWVSEPDDGIYNAMNKGIRLASGKYLYFLNSGDVIYNGDVLKDVSVKLKDGKDIYYGNLLLVNGREKDSVLEMPSRPTFEFFYNSTITHQAAIIKRSLFNKLSYYSESYKLVSDWEFFMRAFCKFNCSYEHLGLVLTRYDTNGLSSREENQKLIEVERKKVLKEQYSFFLKEYEELIISRLLLNSSRYKIFSELEKYSLIRRLNSLWYKLITWNESKIN